MPKTNNKTTRLAKKLIMPLMVLTCVKYRHKLKGILVSSAVATGMLASVQAVANINETAVHSYASSVEKAANTQNIGQIARLIADDAVISLSRQGRGATTLNKSDYLQLLQKSWTQAKNYRFDIQIEDIIITGDNARVQMTTTETWQQDGKSVTLVTSSRATIGTLGSQAVLLRSVAQVTLN